MFRYCMRGSTSLPCCSSLSLSPCIFQFSYSRSTPRLTAGFPRSQGEIVRRTKIWKNNSWNVRLKPHPAGLEPNSWQRSGIVPWLLGRPLNLMLRASQGCRHPSSVHSLSNATALLVVMGNYRIAQKERVCNCGCRLRDTRDVFLSARMLPCSANMSNWLRSPGSPGSPGWDDTTRDHGTFATIAHNQA
ncbi:hypothetical protein GGR57DRAFT_89556 [Xylariaceae sp. FL1272]|nr:hypothetical protein GGR57DRAFT_89556 [Xylariaceae sp. FL1272]